MIGRPKLVLASGSPRRVTLINQAGIEPDALRPANVDETPRRGELPRACANRLARAKAEVALDLVRADEELQGAYILAADTVVAVGRRILPKPDLVDEASECLRLLSGRNHRVHTAICKAGGYAAQGIAGSFIVKISGSYSNVVGLPLYEVTTLLSGEGYPIRLGWLNPV